eukprot:scaffold193788_cov33-Prasinocladus_malaysianus.AAC.1
MQSALEALERPKTLRTFDRKKGVPLRSSANPGGSMPARESCSAKGSREALGRAECFPFDDCAPPCESFAGLGLNAS